MDCGIMWPVRRDMTRDECRKCLRYLELDAYSSMVSVLRAQGPFTSAKQKLLQELAKVLHISNERHRAEIRRAVNDEKLTAIAEQLNGPNTGTDWTIEGRRSIPLLPRLKARSAFTTLANSLSLATAVANERIPLVHEKMEKSKVGVQESQIKLKIEENSSDAFEFSLGEEESNSKESNANEINPFEQQENVESNDFIEEHRVSAKRKSPSPLPTAPPSKVLIVSSNSLEKLNHSIIEGFSENSPNLSQLTVNTQQKNVTIIPVSIPSNNSSSTDSKSPVQGNNGNCINVQANKHVDTECTSIKSKRELAQVQSKPSIIVPSTVISSTVSNVSIGKLSPGNSSTDTQDSIEFEVSDVCKNSDKLDTDEPYECSKRVAPVVQPAAKLLTSKSIATNNSHPIMTVCPDTTVSSGPGPPPTKPTTLTYKKLPTTLNQQTTAKMGVTLNSNKTVNISHHPGTKLASKTNLIVIQKGHTKGVTLSHAGKEVLGKVIMGGKNLCVATHHSGNSINVLPHHIAFNNGDQAVNVLSTANSSHTETVKSCIKPGNAIVFNLRQDVLEKNKVLSQLLESSSVLTSEPKTVIQSTNARSLKEQTNTDLHVVGKEATIKTDTVITCINDDK